VRLLQVFGWNVATGKPVIEISCHTDTIYSISFNWLGTHLVTTSKDKKLRVIDARSGQVVQEATAHDGAKASRALWCGQSNKIFSTGFSRMNERQYGIWNPDDMSKPMKLEMVDTSSGTLFPFYDNDTQIVYLAGKVRFDCAGGAGSRRTNAWDEPHPTTCRGCSWLCGGVWLG
jgi:WD40 repeat protein